MNIAEKIENYYVLNATEKKLIQKKIIDDKTLLDELFESISGKYARKVTRILADISSPIKSQTLSNFNNLKALLCHVDPKVRMHTAEILGNTAAEASLSDLIDAINRENTCFVLPSLLLAIGRAKCDNAKNFLNSYAIKSNLPKHIKAEKSALNKALSNFATRTPTNVYLTSDDTLYLKSSNLNVTAATLRNAAFNIGFKRNFIIIKNIRSYENIFNIRSFSDAYIYLGNTKTCQLSDYLSRIEDTILQKTDTRNYRLEVKNISHNIRKKLIEQCTESFNNLINTPSAYSFEILVHIENDDATVLLNPLNDNRFSYRMKSVAASITGDTAACILEFASKHLKPNAKVLDNFCGSGTMLFERSFYPYKSLTGIDIDKKAICAADTNAASFINKPEFINADALQYYQKKYDEVLTNMPFGNRVGSHRQNICLYKRYFEMLPNILESDGTAVLYTNEKKLTRQLIAQNVSLKLIDKTDFNAGGLSPTAYIIKKQSIL